MFNKGLSFVMSEIIQDIEKSECKLKVSVLYG